MGILAVETTATRINSHTGRGVVDWRVRDFVV